MWLETLIPVFLFLSLATLLQTLSGFGFGLLVVSSFTLFNLLPMTATTFLVSVLGALNSVAIVARNFKLVNRRAFVLMITTGLPFMAVGFMLLEYLSNGLAVWLNILLGTAIICCCLLLVMRKQGAQASGRASGFGIAGALGGFLGGLFSTFGPPVVFQCYRQNWPVHEVRYTLLAVFSVAAMVRIAMVPFGTLPDQTTLIITAVAIPVVLVCTQLGKRLAASFKPQTVRRIALITLAGSGVTLIAKTIPALL